MEPRIDDGGDGSDAGQGQDAPLRCCCRNSTEAGRGDGAPPRCCGPHGRKIGHGRPVGFLVRSRIPIPLPYCDERIGWMNVPSEVP